MSILIKNMNIPKDEPLLVKINPDGTVSTTARNNYKKYEAVELPYHGRLIDVDYADEYAYDELELANKYLTGWEAARAMQKIYQNAPTIIEAEESE